MNIVKLKEALDETIRFQRKAKRVLTAYKGYYHQYGDYYGKEAAATKRASMDLTRALADLRKV